MPVSGPAAFGDALLMIDEVLATCSVPRTVLRIVADRRRWHASPAPEPAARHSHRFWQPGRQPDGEPA
jgi:hypothetical protein